MTLVCEDGNSKLVEVVAVVDYEKQFITEKLALVTRLQGFGELLCLVSKIFMLSSKPIGVVVSQNRRFLSTTII